MATAPSNPVHHFSSQWQARPIDILPIGRSSIDLYSQQPGNAFTDIESFAAYVGGCPTNIAVGTRRLGLKSALLTAIGQDPVGDFILNFLNKETIQTDFIPVKAGKRSSAVVLGIEPPDTFPLMFYRDNCADIELDLDDVEAIPFQSIKSIVVSGTGFSKDPSQTATRYACEKAKEAGCLVILDLDFRADQWYDPRAFGVSMRQLLPMIDLCIGTEEEIKAAVSGYAGSTMSISIGNHSISDPTINGDTKTAIKTLQRLGTSLQGFVVKRGAEGAKLLLPTGDTLEASPFKVDILNVLGAGDAFASGFLFGYLQGWPWQECLKLGNATGAIVVTKPGCANFMPTFDEAHTFMTSQNNPVSEAYRPKPSQQEVSV